MRKERTANDAGALVTSARARNALGAGCRRVYTPAFVIAPEDENGIIVATMSGVATLDKNLPDGFRCKVVNDHAGQVGFVAEAGATIGNTDDQFAMKGLDAVVDILVKANIGEASAAVLLGGDTAAFNDTTPWTLRTSADDTKQWVNIIWVEELGLWVSTAANGADHRVMTSPDGVTWTARVAPNDAWWGLCWSPELHLLVAVGSNGGVMTSPDGIVWTLGTAADDAAWESVAWSAELGLFVAFATGIGTGNNMIMRSADGLAWVGGGAPGGLGYPDTEFQNIIWMEDPYMFVVTGDAGSGNDLMTSVDGINWTFIDGVNSLNALAWAPGLGVVALSDQADGRGYFSKDGVNWTAFTGTPNGSWIGATWAPELGLFIAVQIVGNPNAMISADGVNWSTITLADPASWLYHVAWSSSQGFACVVGLTGAKRVQTSNPL